MKIILLVAGLLMASGAHSQSAGQGESQNLSGNAVPSAESNAKAAAEAEQRNNANAGSSTSAKGADDSTVYPKSASPDVRDSYNTENRVGSASAKNKKSSAKRKYQDRERSSGSTTLDSFSGSSSLPEKKTVQDPSQNKNQTKDQRKNLNMDGDEVQ